MGRKKHEHTIGETLIVHADSFGARARIKCFKVCPVEKGSEIEQALYEVLERQAGFEGDFILVSRNQRDNVQCACGIAMKHEADCRWDVAISHDKAVLYKDGDLSSEHLETVGNLPGCFNLTTIRFMIWLAFRGGRAR